MLFNSSEDCYGVDAVFLYKAFAALNIVLGITACLFAIFALVALFLLDKHLFYNQRLLIYLNISIILGSLVSITSINPFLAGDADPTRSHYCTVNGILYNWSILTQLMIIWLVTIDLFRLSRSVDKLLNHPGHVAEIVLVSIAFFLPPLLLWVPAISSIDLYGPDGPLCDLQTLNYTTCKKIYNGYIALAVYRIGPFVLSFTIIPILILISLCRLRTRGMMGRLLSCDPQRRELVNISGTVWQLQTYPLLYFIFSIPPIIHFIIQGREGIDALALITYFFYIFGNNFRGISLSFAFLFNKDTRACFRKIRERMFNYKGGDSLIASYHNQPSLYCNMGDSLDAREYHARRKGQLQETLIQEE